MGGEEWGVRSGGWGVMGERYSAFVKLSTTELPRRQKCKLS